MKKIFVIFIFLFLAVTMYGCKEIDINYQFKNNTIQTKAEIQEQIAFYSQRLLDQVPEFNMSVSAFSLNELEPGETTYSRDDLPPQYDYPYDPDVIDPHFVFNSARALEVYKEALDKCIEFEENVFCTIEYEDYDLYLNIKSEDDQLFIEGYIYSTFIHEAGTIMYVAADIMYLNLVDEKVYFEMVRDQFENSGGVERHKIYYDKYYETGDMINISIDMNQDDNVYYQNYVRSNQNVFLFANTEEGLGFNYSDYLNHTFHSVSFDENHEVDNIFISYGVHNPSLRYGYSKSKAEKPIRLNWNVLDIDGWDHVIVNDYGRERIFSGEIERLTNFTIDFQIHEYMTANAYAFFSEEELIDGLISLSDYGLSFDIVTLEQLNEDIPYLENNYVSILESFGFVEDMSENKALLLASIPFFADQNIVTELMGKAI